ncbi:hypothetical protein [Rosistilla oblonga]|uniref:hypothetical protein n=1 Tax=Rosistilla oblonga TaxID=2527990 RepID=UPI003A97A302
MSQALSFQNRYCPVCGKDLAEVAETSTSGHFLAPVIELSIGRSPSDKIAASCCTPCKPNMPESSGGCYGEWKWEYGLLLAVWGDIKYRSARIPILDREGQPPTEHEARRSREDAAMLDFLLSMFKKKSSNEFGYHKWRFRAKNKKMAFATGMTAKAAVRNVMSVAAGEGDIDHKTQPDDSPMQICIVCDMPGRTAVYLNGELQERDDHNDAYEIARLTQGKPCVVTTWNPGCLVLGEKTPKRLDEFYEHEPTR